LAAAADEGGITVVGVGEACGKPNALEFRARLAGSGELANDALTKYQEFKRRALAAVDQLEFKEVKVSVGPLSLLHGGDQNQVYAMMMPGMAGTEAGAKVEVALSSLLRVTMHKIEEMSEEQVFELATQLVDKLKDSGVRIHATQGAVSYVDPENEEYALPLLATFVVDDATELYEQARRRAYQAARANAEKMAELAELRLGPVESMREITPETAAATQVLWNDVEEMEMDMPVQRVAAAQPAKLRLTSRTFAEVPVHVSLRVRFRTRPIADEKKGKEGT
jgi:hypothetical protein